MVRNCTACDLAGGEYALQRVVGDKTRAVLIIGEAPGRKEGETGLPFVGRAGKVLDMWCDYMGIKNYVVTNMVKHRPPNNRTPTPLEVGACTPILDWEISTVKPHAIILVGKTPVRILGKDLWKKTGDELATLSRAGFLSYRGIPVFCLPHPAYLIRKGYSSKIPDSLGKLLASCALKLRVASRRRGSPLTTQSPSGESTAPSTPS